jgi:hypothetical protein
LSVTARCHSERTMEPYAKHANSPEVVVTGDATMVEDGSDEMTTTTTASSAGVEAQGKIAGIATTDGMSPSDESEAGVHGGTGVEIGTGGMIGIVDDE